MTVLLTSSCLKTAKFALYVRSPNGYIIEVDTLQIIFELHATYEYVYHNINVHGIRGSFALCTMYVLE